MKVYTAERHYGYEGFVILGVFRRRQDAQNAVNKDGNRGDCHEVEEYNLDELILDP